ncbi:MAG: hypothetical protein J6D11_04160 [Clostridia bacterium]|nr:hypothetical protein [Clostridia bacterium]
MRSSWQPKSRARRLCTTISSSIAYLSRTARNTVGRKAVDNHRRRLEDPELKKQKSAERSTITRKMTNVRREINLADDILYDSIRLAKAIAAEKACEERLVPDRTKQKHKEQVR